MQTYQPGSAFRLTSRWNPSRVHPVTQEVRPHRGEDWAAPSGTAIPSAGHGEVVTKGTLSGYGHTVVVEHKTLAGEIIHTLYAHMNGPSPLNVGDIVDGGETVGFVGNSGTSSGPHLHFEILPNGKKGAPNLVKGHDTVDPREFDLSQLDPGEGLRAGATLGRSTGFGDGVLQQPAMCFKDDWMIGGIDPRPFAGRIGAGFEFSGQGFSARASAPLSFSAPAQALTWTAPEAD